MSRKFLLWLMQTKVYRWFLLKFMPGKRFTWKVPSIKGSQFNEGHHLLKPGDIVLCIDTRAFTGASIKYLTKGEFSHAALSFGRWPDYEIAEMLGEGYTRSCFYDLVHESERVVILRCKDFDEEYIKKMLAKCESFCSAQYDIEFDLGIQALYCSELVYQSDFERRLQVDLSDLAGLGRKYISPTGLYHAKNVEVVWDSQYEFWGSVIVERVPLFSPPTQAMLQEPQISTIEEASESQQSPRSIQDSKKELHDFLDAINHE